MAEPTIVDADGHVVEPEAMWQQYIEDKRYHWGAPRAVVDREGRRRVFIEGQLCPPQEAPPKLAPAEQNLTSRAGGYDSRARIEDLDDEGIDLAVLFPSTAMRVIGVKDPGLANALCAAYNNWLFDYCKPHPERLVGAARYPGRLSGRGSLSLLGKGAISGPNGSNSPPGTDPSHGHKRR